MPYTSRLKCELWNKQNPDSQHQRLTYGKYLGFMIKDLPTNYIRWTIQNQNDSNLIIGFIDELIERTG